MPVLAAADFNSPLFWALLIAWVMSVVLHEFAHGVVAYWGGDYTIRERGGLTLNPLQYVHPVMSILLPLLFLYLGGVPLPGGATYVRRDLLRSRAWDTAVSAAGPAMNLLLFFLLAALLHPRVGWVDPSLAVAEWTQAQKLVAATAFLQLFSVLLNLVPVPPLDGFQMISPYLAPSMRERLMQPQVSMLLLFGFFLLVSSKRFQTFLYDIMRPITRMAGSDLTDLVSAARICLYGHP
jgi:Zn-dependent protease